MKSEKVVFGQYKGEDIYLFTLENDNGMVVKIMNYGATITSIEVPGPGGKPLSVACGFDRFEDYFSDDYTGNAPYFGCTVGRYCGMIKDARFELEGQSFVLAANAGNNNLHGGKTGFDKKVWKAEAVSDGGKVGVEFSLRSPDGEEGFPGKVEASVRMCLNNDNEIILSYSATSDKATPLTMTNHTYFNLSGFNEDILGHVASVKSTERLECDDTGAATGKLLSVEGAADDLREGKVIGEVHEAIGGGFEHFYIFDGVKDAPRKLAGISNPGNGLCLEVESTEPCMLLYTGKYTSDDLKRNEAEHYGQFRGFCCETQRWQNGPNIPGSPGTILRPGETYESRTIFRLKGI